MALNPIYCIQAEPDVFIKLSENERGFPLGDVYEVANAIEYGEDGDGASPHCLPADHEIEDWLAAHGLITIDAQEHCHPTDTFTAFYHAIQIRDHEQIDWFYAQLPLIAVEDLRRLKDRYADTLGLSPCPDCGAALVELPAAHYRMFACPNSIEWAGTSFQVIQAAHYTHSQVVLPLADALVVMLIELLIQGKTA